METATRLWDMSEKIEQLSDENERLRATLKGLVESCEYLRDGAFHNKRRYTNCVSQSAWSSFCLQVRTARAALAEKGEK
jgi:cell division protein FtsB